MSARTINGWEDVYAEVKHRLGTRRWKAGERLPDEVELAAEFGCARGTVNRALQAIADEGLLERRRRGGTRVVVHPERKATLSIPVIRREIERLGHAYGYRLVGRRSERAPASVRERMGRGSSPRLLHVQAVHTADERPYVLEDRWIDVAVVPTIVDVDLAQRSANEWLVENAPFSGGELVLSATIATAGQARMLGCEEGAALFVTERRTRDSNDLTITAVTLTFAPGYAMTLAL